MDEDVTPGDQDLRQRRHQPKDYQQIPVSAKEETGAFLYIFLCTVFLVGIWILTCYMHEF
jgi:hypothetical protein